MFSKEEPISVSYGLGIEARSWKGASLRQGTGLLCGDLLYAELPE